MKSLTEGGVRFQSASLMGRSPGSSGEDIQARSDSFFATCQIPIFQYPILENGVRVS